MQLGRKWWDLTTALEYFCMFILGHTICCFDGKWCYVIWLYANLSATLEMMWHHHWQQHGKYTQEHSICYTMLLSLFAMFIWWPYILFRQEVASHHLSLHQPECNLAGSDVTSPLSTGSQQKPYGHHECFLVEKIVSNILKKAHGRNFDKRDDVHVIHWL